jgi:hypothetical protein
MFQNAFAVILQLCLASLAFAAPIADETLSATTTGTTWQYGTGGGVIGFIILVLDILVWSRSSSKLFQSLQTANHLVSSRGPKVEPSP